MYFQHIFHLLDFRQPKSIFYFVFQARSSGGFFSTCSCVLETFFLNSIEPIKNKELNYSLCDGISMRRKVSYRCQIQKKNFLLKQGLLLYLRNQSRRASIVLDFQKEYDQNDQKDCDRFQNHFSHPMDRIRIVIV